MLLTYYAINYDNQVSTPIPAEQANILLEESQWSSRIQRNPSQQSVDAICNSAIFVGPPGQCALVPIAAIVDTGPQNLAMTREKGFDLKLDQSLDTRYGKVLLGLNGTYMFSFDKAGSRTSPLLDVVNTVSNPLKLRIRSTADWYQRGWNLPGFGAIVSQLITGADTATPKDWPRDQ